MSGEYAYKPGTKLLLELVQGEKYAGHVLYCEDDQITLKRVYDYVKETEGTNNFPYHFYEKEIRKITILEEVYEPLSDERPLSFYQKHHEQLNVMIQNYIYISDNDISFYYAIQRINRCDVISIAGLLPHCGRNRCVMILAVGTRDQVFIFDLRVMGTALIEHGLKRILESNQILKVIHGCQISESLFRHHDVCVSYIFNTQIADLKISLNANSTVRPKRRFIRECMAFYLGVPEKVTSVLLKSYIRRHGRPLPEYFKMAMAIETVYLLHLKAHLEKKFTS